MEFYQSVRYSSALEQAIDRNPFIVTPETSLADVIKVLGLSQNHCLLNPSHSSVEDSRANCVFVIHQDPEEFVHVLLDEHPQPSSLLGIVTERDIVQLIAAGILDNLKEAPLHKIRVAEIMSPVTVSLTESDDQDIFTALSLFRQHQILHLPVLDSRGQLVGVISPERIRRVLQPSNILRLRRVGDEMLTQVVTAPVTTSVLSLAQMMAAHQASCVVIFQTGTRKKLTPVGLVTEQDIVEAQFLELDLTLTPATTVMGTLSFSLKPNDSLWLAHQEMQKQQVQRLVVCGDEGELLGIITQVSLLRMLDPTEMYRVVKQLQQSVNQLQTEKLELLKSRNAELEKQVQERTSKIHEQLQRERLLAKISMRIHQSLNLDEILNATVAEVRQFLQADRVFIYHIESDQTGKLVAESVAIGCKSLANDQLFKESVQCYLTVFEQDNIYAVSDIQKSSLSPEEINQLNQQEVTAYLVVPILQDGQLWGIITAHQCSGSRHWQPSETLLLQQLATQLAIAIQQAQLYQQVQALNTDLERQVQDRTAELQQKVQELQQLNILKDDFLSTVSHELRTPLANMKMAIHMLKIAPNSERGQKYLEILESECLRETNLINDLLDLQRLESSSTPIALESLDLLEWLPNIINPFYSRTQERQQVLTVSYYPHLQPIRTNANSLERILAELLNNACKYSPNGGEIFLGIHYRSLSNWLELISTPKTKRKGKKQENSLLSPSISDSLQIVIRNPAEIPAKELPRIFEKFYRVPNADPWKQGGTGLGLALVQKLVEQLGGTIQVESDPNLTTFTIEFPY
ncbi:CBS domain-containing protein [Planktothrix sp. FACHB-1365]|uniref:CBS domain-containing protein n=1 Tax=Planktothrix sp. FACHB-1365 TaxID=2692855 RepID=UPI00168221FE|nr:CBS domain-containing protein [Planktothrix sp. FACHB-1365]MBD2483663.1 CBS domain-containing protein [Planktothrix sp. FACHB-1365]